MTKLPIIMGIDFGLRRTGVAVLQGDAVLHMEVIRPGKAILDWTTWHRADWIAEEVFRCYVDNRVHHVAIEMPDGHVHKRNKARGQGLDLWGMGCGIVWKVAQGFVGSPQHLHPITVHEWTRAYPPHKRSKQSRARLLEVVYPAYAEFRDMGKDRGFDVADALGVARFCQSTLRLQEATDV